MDDGRVPAGIFADPASLEVTHASIPLSSVVRAIHPATYVVGRYSTMAPQGDLTCSTVLITAPQVAIKTEHDALPLSNYQICSSLYCRCTCPLCLTYEVHQPSTRNASRTYCLLNTVIPVSVMPVELKSLLTTLPNSVNIIIAHVGTSDTTWQQSNMTKSDFSTLVDSGILRVLYLCYI